MRFEKIDWTICYAHFVESNREVHQRVARAHRNRHHSIFLHDINIRHSITPAHHSSDGHLSGGIKLIPQTQTLSPTPHSLPLNRSLYTHVSPYSVIFFAVSSTSGTLKARCPYPGVFGYVVSFSASGSYWKSSRVGPSVYLGRRRCMPVMCVSLRLRASSSHFPLRSRSGGTGLHWNTYM